MDNLTQPEDIHPLKTYFGDMIAIHRKRRRLTQVQAAVLAGVSPKYMGEIERGDANPTLDLLVRIIAVCGWDIAAGQEPSIAASGQTVPVPIALLLGLKHTQGELNGIMTYLDACTRHDDTTGVNDMTREMLLPATLRSVLDYPHTRRRVGRPRANHALTGA